MGIGYQVRLLIAKEPVIFVSCLLGGLGIFLPAVVKPILEKTSTADPVEQPSLNQVITGMTGRQDPYDKVK